MGRYNERKDQLNITIDADIRAQLDRLEKLTGISRPDQIRSAIMDWLQKHKIEISIDERGKRHFKRPKA